MARTSREIMAAGFEEIDTRLSALEQAIAELPGKVASQVAAVVDQKLGHYAVKLDQAIDAIRTTADGLGEHRQHAASDMSDLGADVVQLKNRVAQLERRAGNGGE